MKGSVCLEESDDLTRRELLRRLGSFVLVTSSSFAFRNNSPASKALTGKLQEFVHTHQIAGAVALVSRSGRIVYEEAVGSQDLGSGKVMRTDTIFDIRSMTKGVTAIAVMCLVEDAKLSLEDPVSRYLPEFAELRVSESGGQLRAPKRPVTLLDLLTHTSGMSEIRPQPIENITRVLDRSLQEVVDTIAKQPLSADPGAPWNYSSMGYAVLGRVVEVRSGKPYQDFVAERILRPLDMRDSFYFPPREKESWIAAMYIMENGTLKRDSIDIYRRGAKYAAPEFGLFSTGRDMARLFETMRNGGSLGKHRILSQKTVATMLDPRVSTGMEGVSQGLGWFVCTEPARQPALRISKGSFGVAGASGTFGWADPEQQLVRLFLIQRFSGSDSERNAFMWLAADVR
jgi:CubicO group peptidase (beta-lactamase class C family)